MAEVPKIPFAAPRIPTRPVSTRDTSIARSIDVIGRAAIDAGVSHLEDKVTKDLATLHVEQDESQQALTDDVIAEATGLGFSAESGLSAVENEQMRSLLRAQGRFRLQMEQGIISEHEFSLRAEAVLREHINRNPRLAANFISTAQRELGFNPIARNASPSRGGGSKTTPFDEAIQAVVDMGESIGIAKDLLARDPAEYFNQVFAGSAKFAAVETMKNMKDMLGSIGTFDRQVDSEANFNLIRRVASDMVQPLGTLSIKEVSDVIDFDLASLPNMSIEERNKAWTDDNIQRAVGALDQLEVDLRKEFSEARSQNLTDEEFESAIAPALIQIQYFKSLLNQDDALKQMGNYQKGIQLGLTATEEFQRTSIGMEILGKMPPDVLTTLFKAVAVRESFLPFFQDFMGLRLLQDGTPDPQDGTETLPDPIKSPELYMKGNNERLFSAMNNVFKDARASGGKPEVSALAAEATVAFIAGQAANMTKAVKNRGQRISEPVFISWLNLVSSPSWAAITDFVDEAAQGEQTIGGVPPEELASVARLMRTDVPAYLAVEIREQQLEITSQIRKQLVVTKAVLGDPAELNIEIDIRGLASNQIVVTSRRKGALLQRPLNIDRELIVLAKLTNAMINTTTNTQARETEDARINLFKAFLEEAIDLQITYAGESTE